LLKLQFVKFLTFKIAEKILTFLAANIRVPFFGSILPPLPSADVVIIWTGRANVYGQITVSRITCKNRRYKHLQKSIIAIEANSAVKISE
jgi:hypothetical protein